jgi:hypothetical protein
MVKRNEISLRNVSIDFSKSTHGVLRSVNKLISPSHMATPPELKL